MRRRNLVIVSITILALAGLMFPYERPEVLIKVHLEMWHYRNGELLLYTIHPGTLTDQGADFAEDQLFDSPSTDPAKWIGVSDSTSSPSSAWIVLPAEITGDGMTRKVATYTNDGVGQCNLTVTFNPTASGSCRLGGIYTALTGDTLFCADQFGVVTYEASDTIELRFTLTLAGS